jgi:hypothetical protein
MGGFLPDLLLCAVLLPILLLRAVLPGLQGSVAARLAAWPS